MNVVVVMDDHGGVLSVVGPFVDSAQALEWSRNLPDDVASECTSMISMRDANDLFREEESR